MKAESHHVEDIQELRDLATLQAQMQKPARHTNIDGSFELGWGTMLLCAGLVPYFNAAVPKALWSSPWLAYTAYGAPALHGLCSICHPKTGQTVHHLAAH